MDLGVQDVEDASAQQWTKKTYFLQNCVNFELRREQDHSEQS